MLDIRSIVELCQQNDHAVSQYTIFILMHIKSVPRNLSFHRLNLMGKKGTAPVSGAGSENLTEVSNVQFVDAKNKQYVEWISGELSVITACPILGAIAKSSSKKPFNSGTFDESQLATHVKAKNVPVHWQCFLAGHETFDDAFCSFAKVSSDAQW